LKAIKLNLPHAKKKCLFTDARVMVYTRHPMARQQYTSTWAVIFIFAHTATPNTEAEDIDGDNQVVENTATGIERRSAA
jgi:hypothetical protein